MKLLVKALAIGFTICWILYAGLVLLALMLDWGDAASIFFYSFVIFLWILFVRAITSKTK